MFYAVLVVAAAVGVTGIWLGVLIWLSVINLVLALFNLVPAAPLDGGRILRALLWMRRGDRTSAAITASRAGRIFGFTLIGLGLIEIVVAPGFGGLWFVLIGWFIANAASMEEQHARMSASLADVRVSDVMTREPATAPTHLTLDRFLDEYVLRARHAAFPLTADGGRPAGLVTLNRMKQVRREDWPRTTVASVAVPAEAVPTALPTSHLPSCCHGSPARRVDARS